MRFPKARETYFSKSRKHNYVGDSSQHTYVYSNSETPMGETSQRTFQNQENATMSVIQVNILMEKAIQKHYG